MDGVAAPGKGHVSQRTWRKFHFPVEAEQRRGFQFRRRGKGLKQHRSCTGGEDRTLSPGRTRRSSAQKGSLLPRASIWPPVQGPLTGTSPPPPMPGAELLLIKPFEHRQMWACSQFLHDSGLALLKMVQLKGALEVVLSSPLHSLPTLCILSYILSCLLSLVPAASPC